MVAKRRYLIFVTLMAASWDAEAQVEACDPGREDCVAVGEWRFDLGVGMGLRTNPLLNEDDNPLVLLPELSYYGERFFLNNLEMGFTLVDRAQQQLNLVLMPGYDQMYFNRWDPLNFTSDGGFGAASGGPPVSTSGFAVSVNYTQPSAPEVPNPPDGGVVGDGSGGFGGEGDSGGGATDGPGSPGEYVPDPEPQTVEFDAATALIINGITVDLGTDAYVGGVGNNRIAVTSDTAGNVSVTGLQEGDSLEVVYGAEGVAYAVEVRDERLNVSEAPLPNEPSTLATGAWVDSLDKRRMTALAGLEYSWYASFASFHLQVLSDVLNVHGGQEVRAAMTLPFEAGRSRFAATLGANWQSREVVDYYYGLKPAEAQRIGIGQYRPDGGALTPLLRLDWQHSLTEHWSLRALWQFMPLSDAAKDSPFVEGEAVHSVFFGGVYHF